MSAVVAFPEDRIIRRPAADLDAVTVAYRGDSLTFATREDFLAEAREYDPELKRRLAAAAAAIAAAQAMRVEAEDALQRARDRADTWRQVELLFALALLAGVIAAIVFTGARP